MWTKENFCTLLRGIYKLVQSLWNSVWMFLKIIFLKKLNIELSLNLAIPLLGMYVKKNGSTNLKVYMHLVFTAALFTIVNYMHNKYMSTLMDLCLSATQMSINRQMDKDVVQWTVTEP